MRIHRAVLAVLALAMAPALAAPIRSVPGVRSGLIVVAPDGVSLAERVTFDPATGPGLAALAVGESAQVPNWPVAPGERASVRLTRREVYAPDAHVYRADRDRLVELPRSSLHFFEGRVDREPDARVVAWVDPDVRSIEGLSLTRRGEQEIRRISVAPGDALVGSSNALSGGPTTWACGQEGISLAEQYERSQLSAPPMPAPSVVSVPLATSTATKQIVIAFDTDNELMSINFSDQSTPATNYVASLVAVMSPIYERDLSVKLVQGTVILRPSTTPDPYSAGPDVNGNASSAELNEFSNTWSTTYGGVSRGLAQMLSGKQPANNNASGIAWIGPVPQSTTSSALCSTSMGYSFTQVFKGLYAGASNDALVNAHEIGHNFGSPHTHCGFSYDATPPIDQCYSGESGCYSGATSCPATATYQGVPNVKGTLMSYCHLLQPYGSCSSSLVFHPTTVSHLLPKVAAASCFTSTGASRFYALAPCRVVDTRNATGPYGGPMLAGGGASRSFTLPGQCGIPTGAVSVSANVTVTGAATAGDLRIVPGDQSAGFPTTINFRGGRTIANNAHLMLAGNGAGTINVTSDGPAVHFILDVSGYYQ